MLGKLLKYEWKATARIFLPLFVLLLILTPITKLVLSLDIFKGFTQIIPSLTLISYIVLIIAICVTAFIFMIYRFYKNLLTEEGYLMFTLPVSVHSIVLSKAIVSFFWTILCYVAAFLSITAVIYTPETKDQFFYYYDVITKGFYSEMNISLTGLIVWSVVLMILSQIYTIFYAYCSIAIGQLSTHKIVGAIAASIAIYIIMQIISSVVLLPISFTANSNNPQQVIYNTYIIIGALNIIFIAVFYFITTNILQKKLNLN